VCAEVLVDGSRPCEGDTWQALFRWVSRGLGVRKGITWSWARRRTEGTGMQATCGSHPVFTFAVLASSCHGVLFYQMFKPLCLTKTP
jgi:hypothetical protein